jgi:hypothetical protein
MRILGSGWRILKPNVKVGERLCCEASLSTDGSDISYRRHKIPDTTPTRGELACYSRERTRNDPVETAFTVVTDMPLEVVPSTR